MVRVASVVFSNFPADPRPRREAEALVEAGMAVDMICLRGENQAKRETDKGVNVYRVNLKRTRSSKLLYLWQYGYFISAAFLRLSWLHLRNNYQVIHVHNMPDVLVFCALIPKLTGARVILDLHDPMSEIFITKYGIPETHLVIRSLKLFERLSMKFAHKVLTPNKAFRDLFISRGCPEEKIQIVMNSPQENIFNNLNINEKRISNRGKGDLNLMYHGYIADYNGLDVAIKAIRILKEEIPNVKLNIFGDGPYLDDCCKIIKEYNVNDSVHVHGYAQLEEISKEINKTDIGLVPNKSTPFTECNFPTRIFEYLSMRTPVVCSRTAGVLDYFDESELCYYEPGNPNDLAHKILKLHYNREYSNKILDSGYKVYDSHRWEQEKNYFVDLVNQQVSVNASEQLC